VGRYRILRELGRGSMGVVYAADDPVLGRRVALKTIQQDLGGEAYQKRFFAEARAAAGLSHPGIVVVYDIGKDAATRQLFMALEYLEGRTLEQVIAGDSRPDWRAAAAIGAAVAEALHHAHERGIVHRDIKPSNVMLLPTGEPKIMDFGIAKLPASQLTRAGEVMGSPAYMSPERAREQPVDHRADIFSLGAVLYELLTGRRAFGAPSIPAILRRVASEDPALVSQLVPGLPAALGSIVQRALAKDPRRRHASSGELAAELRALLGRAPAATRRSAVSLPEGALGTAVAGGTPRTSTALALPENLRVSLAILSGPGKGRAVSLERPRLVIGRAGVGKADLEIDDAEVSGAHAAIECRGEQIALRDLASTNGTWIGKERIAHADLEDGAEFRIGKTRFMLTLSLRELD
jgi:serine/threonine protein kinase